MTYILVRHKVKDYEKWKLAFDEHGTTRKDSGSKGGRLFSITDDKNEVVIIFEWDNLENAQKFARSEDLKKIMQQAGVIDKPDIYFLEEIEKVKR